MAKSPFTVDWDNKDAVIAYAHTLGKGMTVFKHPCRKNYNITFTERTDQYQSEQVVFQTR